MDVSFVLAMSIAVTVVVRPSRVLNALLRGMCLCVASVGIAIGFAWIGDLSLTFRISIAVACIMASTACFYAKYNRDMYRISISGDGQMRVSEYAAVSGAMGHFACEDVYGEVFPVSLQDNSIVWPLLLLLRLKADNEKTFIVPILTDSLSASGFRSLSVACQWIAMHNQSAQKKS